MRRKSAYDSFPRRITGRTHPEILVTRVWHDSDDLVLPSESRDQIRNVGGMSVKQIGRQVDLRTGQLMFSSGLLCTCLSLTEALP